MESTMLLVSLCTLRRGISLSDRRPRNFIAVLITRALHRAEIMTEITDELYSGWDEFNADAFVNAWVSGHDTL